MGWYIKLTFKTIWLSLCTDCRLERTVSLLSLPWAALVHLLIIFLKSPYKNKHYWLVYQYFVLICHCVLYNVHCGVFFILSVLLLFCVLHFIPESVFGLNVKHFSTWWRCCTNKRSIIYSVCGQYTLFSLLIVNNGTTPPKEVSERPVLCQLLFSENAAFMVQYTVHSGSKPVPPRFSHFFILQPYAKNLFFTHQSTLNTS